LVYVSSIEAILSNYAQRSGSFIHRKLDEN
jgi:hypothetical protein